MDGVKEYKIPKILFIKGVFLKDCMPIDDIFEQRLMDQLEVEETVVSYNRLPSTFNDFDSWPKQTNIKCWNCDLAFAGVPVFVPRGIDVLSETKYDIGREGCFCSFHCAEDHIELHNKKICDVINRREMLLFLYKVFTGKVVKEILRAPSKYIMKHYGGSVEPTEYQMKIRELQKQQKELEL